MDTKCRELLSGINEIPKTELISISDITEIAFLLLESQDSNECVKEFIKRRLQEDCMSLDVVLTQIGMQASENNQQKTEKKANILCRLLYENCKWVKSRTDHPMSKNAAIELVDNFTSIRDDFEKYYFLNAHPEIYHPTVDYMLAYKSLWYSMNEDMAAAERITSLRYDLAESRR